MKEAWFWFLISTVAIVAAIWQLWLLMREIDIPEDWLHNATDAWVPREGDHAADQTTS